MLEQWLQQEKAIIKSRFGNVRIFCVFLACLTVPAILIQLVLLLDGGGIGQVFAIIFFIFVIFFALTMSSYKKRFVKPLLTSIQQELLTEEARREFVQQMQEQAVCISYQPLPQIKSCDIMVANDYCYMRQPGKSRIIRNKEIRRAVLTQENYNTGNRGHVRQCYALALYAADNEKPVWKGYFMNKEEVSQAFLRFKAVLPPDADIQDYAANPEKGSRKPLWKTLLEWALCILFLAAMIYFAKYFGN